MALVWPHIIVFEFCLTYFCFQVIEGKVYQARGYALGYPVMLVTPEDSLILIDAPEGAKIAQVILDAFRAIPAIGTKPIVAIIYTIFHPDHLFGVEVGYILYLNISEDNSKPRTLIDALWDFL